MEYGLRLSGTSITTGATVLILVVMEYGLRHLMNAMTMNGRLNPCCNGIWSQTKRLRHCKHLLFGS